MQNDLDENAEKMGEDIVRRRGHPGRWASELRALIDKGAEANTLRRLLKGDDVEHQTTAAFIVSQASPSQTSSLLGYAFALSQHVSERVRAYIIDFIVNQGRSLPDDAERAAEMLLHDRDRDVRDYGGELFSRAGIV
jgi:hypothetical protein